MHFLFRKRRRSTKILGNYKNNEYDAPPNADATDALANATNGNADATNAYAYACTNANANAGHANAHVWVSAMLALPIL